MPAPAFDHDLCLLERVEDLAVEQPQSMVASQRRCGSARSRLKLDVDAYYNAVRPEADRDTWLLKTTLTFMFPE
jgi:hypothetical protein